MQIVIFGANGMTGRLLTRRVLDAGHSAVAVTRRPDDFPITDPRLTIAGADVRRDGLAGIVAGADAVLSTLGVPFTRQPGRHVFGRHRQCREHDARERRQSAHRREFHRSLPCARPARCATDATAV